MNDITPNPAPKKSSGTIIVILLVLIILIVGIALSMHTNTPPIAPVEESTPTTAQNSSTPSPDQQIQNIDSLNANLDNQQFEGTSDSVQ